MLEYFKNKITLKKMELETKILVQKNVQRDLNKRLEMEPGTVEYDRVTKDAGILLVSIREEKKIKTSETIAKVTNGTQLVGMGMIIGHEFTGPLASKALALEKIPQIKIL